MKKFLVSLMVFASFNVLAEVKTIQLEKTLSGYYSHMQGEFAINSELGRAWVVVRGVFSDPESSSDEYRIKIEGLSYNKETKQVVYTDGERTAVCANIKITRILKDQFVKQTEACKFEERTIKARVDDGFEIKTKAYDIFDLKIDLQ